MRPDLFIVFVRYAIGPGNRPGSPILKLLKFIT